jgi:hypothetical protein
MTKRGSVAIEWNGTSHLSRVVSSHATVLDGVDPNRPPYGIIMAPVLVFPLLKFTIVVGHLAVSSTTNPQIRSLCTWRALCLFRKPFGFPANVEKKHSKPTLCRSPVDGYSTI